MPPDDYRRAFDAACREYEQLNAERTALDKRLVELHQTINSLSRLLGYVPSVPWGLTDACRVLLKSAARPMTALDLRDRLQSVGFDLERYANALAAIHTVLKRLTESDEVRFVPRGYAKPAYSWKRAIEIIRGNDEHGEGEAPADPKRPRRRKK